LRRNAASGDEHIGPRIGFPRLDPERVAQAIDQLARRLKALIGLALSALLEPLVKTEWDRRDARRDDDVTNADLEH
jgi:hypothetical protein